MKLSKEKRDKISEQILAALYTSNPQTLFTSYVAKEIARDEEFTKKILQELKKKLLVSEIRKNPKGIEYARRSRWTLSDAAYRAYKNKQTSF